MKIRVYAPGFCDDQLMDDKGMMEVKEKITVREVLVLLRTPVLLRTIVMVAVNYQRVKKNHVLSDGDVLSIMGPVSGG